MSTSSKDVQSQLVTPLPVTVRDLIVSASATSVTPNPAGEFGRLNLTADEQARTADRVFAQIELFILKASVQHQQNYYENGQLKAGNESKVTRVITNEFFFYTQKPFSLAEFEALQQRVFDLAKTQPENVHLILGSFAVLTGDNKVMNVFAQFECGAQPRINLIVKNTPSSNDPVYSLKNPDGTRLHLLNATSGWGDMKDSLYSNVARNSISIDNKPHHFSYNTVWLNHVANKPSFFTCTDICLDHSYGIAKSCLTESIMESTDVTLPLDLTHVVVSNTVVLVSKNCLGSVTHATINHDPINVSNTVLFGTPYQYYQQAEKKCDPLPAADADLVRNLNQPLAPRDDKNLNSLYSIYSKLERKSALSLAGGDLNCWTPAEEKAVAEHLQGERDPDKALIKKNNMSLLHLAAEKGNLSICQYLLDQGLPIESQNNAGQTPLHCACINGQVNVAILLIEQGAEVFESDLNDETIGAVLLDQMNKGSENACRIFIQVSLHVDAGDEAQELEDAIIHFIEKLDPSKRPEFFQQVMNDSQNKLMFGSDLPIIDTIKTKFPGIERVGSKTVTAKEQLQALKSNAISSDEANKEVDPDTTNSL